MEKSGKDIYPSRSRYLRLLSRIKNNDMKRNLLITILLPILLASFSRCSPQNPYATIAAIPVPRGCTRIQTGADPSPVKEPDGSVPGKTSFAAWLRAVHLKKDKTVFLYNGEPKRNQTAQFAVLDISIGKEDLQQCADAVMRLRAEWLYSRGDHSAIRFRTGEGVWLNFGDWIRGTRYVLQGGRLQAVQTQLSGDPTRGDRRSFDDYLRVVYSYCGTLSLDRQLVPKKNIGDIQIGDVWVHGGSPGHAMLVVDMAMDAKGKKYFLLAQGYMPAQDIHIVVNPVNQSISPWFEEKAGLLETPEWTFYTPELRGWP